MSTSRRLYRAVSRIIHRYDTERLPLRGVIGQQEVCNDDGGVCQNSGIPLCGEKPAE